MRNSPDNPPYFEQLLARLEAGDVQTTEAFGKHVHWGLWESPPEDIATPEEYGQAAELLCLAVLEKANIADGQRILDVGCGFGGTVACLNERHANLKLTGLNIDARQLERARSKVQAEHGNTIKFVEGDATNLPFAENSFDTVLAVECAFHFDREKFLRESSRVLASGGTVALSDFLPEQRAVEYIQAMNLGNNDSVQWTYGNINLEWPLSRYQEVAGNCGLILIESRDITEQTLPTYRYLAASVREWMGETDLEYFLSATRLLETASQRGFIEYQILSFVKAKTC